MPTEGVLKFTVSAQERGGPLQATLWQELEGWRSRLWRQGLVGHDAALNLGYGNVSQRRSGGGFVITGSQTGRLPVLSGEDYVLVTACDFAANAVACVGLGLPSSESLSHGAFYARPEVGAVIHVHCRGLWQSELAAADAGNGGIATTAADVTYGSAALYRALMALSSGTAPAAPDLPLLVVTRGHQDGIFVAGRNLAEAYGLLMDRLSAAGLRDGEA
ncbi:MAG: hypothetical protein A2087_11625 [Spirochaetes bacterium GWD1_61_31]|nr:MAG: hypothetical protein A2Y37_14855 [Spirochaetes bacterium GWB1_60_80]OHD30317.1 MAG: hypothetical protein A2004_02870 [Spirochaetes bacterium GWC1_61_12]OHD35849.1 MAG: hypothetical protein A2087_11625 [Spirochaetes bacterium GWD1_61_31]OHD46791.1 MAG: hypothetical protein A2Y35_10795 [Spirochaetes bacterium GWE1_60_18]OHD61243.1 MAG: hypothetical protein A2Y32_13090 [Spirochaetes bacterium GWF1_60_12]HAP42997.1 hypothetical protein [Spirochaetaceae bacterium]